MRPQYEHVLANRDAFLADLFELIRIPSISGEPSHADDVEACAEHLAVRLQRLGLEAEVAPTDGHPAVLARTPHDPSKPTVLVYGHYDVQPVEPLALWHTPPFEPTVKNDTLYARGATDDKGQLYTHIAAVRAFMETDGATPVNVKFLIEGEEEIGSPNLESLLKRRKNDLACDTMLISDTAMHGPGLPAICYSLRGLVYVEVMLTGPATDLHSGSHGGAVDNPANVLARLLASLHDDDRRVAIPGFYDDVRPLTEADREAFRALDIDEEAYRKAVGAPELAGERGYSSPERASARPSLDINGLVSGHTGDGPKTVLPSWANAKFSMRLVPDQDPNDIYAKTKAHLEKHCPSTVGMQLRTHGLGKPMLAPLGGPKMRLAAEALEEAFGKAPVYLREGGSIPIVATIADYIDAPCLMLGFGQHDDNAHAPNEKFSLNDLQRGIHASIGLLDRLGQEQNR